MTRQITAIIRKELNSYFGSPLAAIFLGTFLAAVLFLFFTIETFFARGIADVRPLFRWMPLLLIFLLAALTMRQWSEEQRSGTQELLLTLPVSPMALVLGKFLAVMALIALALALTLPLPITVSLIGNLDWGPVAGGYLAALLMAGAYAAIGLFVSSRTDNQIVALILTVVVGGLFYVIGTDGVTSFVGGRISQVLWALGTGSRFESIQRGVIDLRDLAYYLSLTGIFLTLNAISLDAVRWSRGQDAYRRRVTLTAGLVGLNLLLLSVWLYPLSGLRLDLTAQREFSLSQTTRDLFGALQEPLLIRAYISDNTHPALAPLVPQIRDTLREYEIASGGRIAAEVVDPITDPELEAEANQVYGIQPVPFQVSGRYEASVINAYFDILVRYGDQDVVLNFQELIQVEASPSGNVDVRLRNLEYDLTSAIKKVVFGFQSVDAILAALEQPVRLTFLVTPATLPESLADLPSIVEDVAGAIAGRSGGKFVFQTVNPDDPTAPVNRQFLQETYGLQPIPVSFFSADTFYAYLLLEGQDSTQLIYPPAQVTEVEVRSAIESALKRSGSGFLKTVGLWTPTGAALNDPLLGDVMQPLVNYELLRQQLEQDYTVRPIDLSTGQVPADVDVILLIAPQGLTERDLYAIDQFLMRGGSVVVAGGRYGIAFDQFQQGLGIYPISQGVGDWLAHQGVTLGDALVLDPQNAPFPVTVARNVGGLQVQEIQAVDYPFFVDVRPDAMSDDSPIVANLAALTLDWVSPVSATTPTEEGATREIAVLAQSSPGSWLTTDTNVQPDFQTYPALGFPVGDQQGPQPLAVVVQGRFGSYFVDRPNPFADAAEPPEAGAAPAPAAPLGFITESPDTARLVVIGSGSFVEDDILNLSARLTQDRFLNNLQFMQNAVDWAAEDLDLLAIRSRGAATRVLAPLTEAQERGWEIGNYVVALLALAAVYVGWRLRERREEPLTLLPLAEEAGE